MRVQLQVGRDGLEITLPDDRPVRILDYKPPEALSSSASQAALQALLANPTGTPALPEIIQGRQSACIVICDITRPVPNALILEPLLEALHAEGMPADKVTILVATGLHRASRPDEIIEMVGEEIAANYQIINHDARDKDSLMYLGKSPREVPIWVNRRYLEADMKITVGLIEPHFMAGFSGGRKLICPGICGVDTIRAWHSPRFLEHALAITGQLDGNPVHEENSWIAERVGCDFIVNVVVDVMHRPLKFVAGDQQHAFTEGAAFCSKVVSDQVDQEFDIVITSGAGYPLDTTFYQSIKGMDAARPVVRTGGTIILAAGMSEGIGSPEFRSLFEDFSGTDAFMKAISDPDFFVPDQWQLEMLARVLRKAEVQVVTDGLSPDTVESLWVRSSPSVESALEFALQKYGEDASIAVMPGGPYVMPVVTDVDSEVISG
ncbi:MAG: nickel-dependent lactate racemase [Planctomycetota bacterium]|nr:nickel-dependent lactate racemase [Planctomycetota bacterium]